MFEFDFGDFSPLAWAGVAVLVLLAMVGLYYLYTLCRGYRCLPLTTTDCPGGKPHHLVYVDDYELGELAKIAKHTGKPCHGIRSYPPGQRLPDRAERVGRVLPGELYRRRPRLFRLNRDGTSTEVDADNRQDPDNSEIPDAGSPQPIFAVPDALAEVDHLFDALPPVPPPPLDLGPPAMEHAEAFLSQNPQEPF